MISSSASVVLDAGQSRLIERIANIHASRVTDPRAYSPAAYMHGGFEILERGDTYYWDGLKRGHDPLHPTFVFQYTLGGWGIYEALGRSERVVSDKAFLGVLPSAHKYSLPPESPGWQFFWLIVRHPYVVSRMIDLKRRHGAVFDLAADDLVGLRMARLFEGIALLSFRDTFAEEQALFEWMTELERAAHRQAFPLQERERILDDVRTYVRSHITRPVDVAEIGDRFAMSRSSFGHHFKGLTGLSPAAFIRQIRLEEASHHLVNSTQTLEAVANATGFAGANDLCKVFRKHFGMTPGEFRRQMRAGRRM